MISDKHVGHLTYLRVYSGSIEAGQQVLNVRRDRKERVGRLLQMHANKRQEIPAAYAGDIIAVVGFKSVSTGDTLCDARHPIALEAMEFPEPVISIAIEPKTQADMDRLGESLERLAQEDPSFRVTSDPETGQTIISGMGELHLEIICDRLLREFRVGANVGPPQVAYKETIRKTVRSARVATSSRPAARVTTAWSSSRAVAERSRQGIRVHRRHQGRSDPARIHPGRSARVPRRHCRAASSPAIPSSTCACDLLDGQAHDVDSSERSFKIAASIAVREGMREAQPTLLEPIMKVEVVTPDDFVGPVQGDLSSRRGSLTGIEIRAGAHLIHADVPLAAMFGYVNNLRSMTQGRATYTMQFSHYAEVPDAVSAKIVNR